MNFAIFVHFIEDFGIKCSFFCSAVSRNRYEFSMRFASTLYVTQQFYQMNNKTTLFMTDCKCKEIYMQWLENTAFPFTVRNILLNMKGNCNNSSVLCWFPLIAFQQLYFIYIFASIGTKYNSFESR